jgi:hypothetical protein
MTPTDTSVEPYLLGCSRAQPRSLSLWSPQWWLPRWLPRTAIRTTSGLGRTAQTQDRRHDERWPHGLKAVGRRSNPAPGNSETPVVVAVARTVRGLLRAWCTSWESYLRGRERSQVCDRYHAHASQSRAAAARLLVSVAGSQPFQPRRNGRGHRAHRVAVPAAQSKTRRWPEPSCARRLGRGGTDPSGSARGVWLPAPQIERRDGEVAGFAVTITRALARIAAATTCRSFGSGRSGTAAINRW